MTYIVHDPTGFITDAFEKLEDAIKFANKCCLNYLDENEFGWCEVVENITVSKLLYRATQCDVKKKSDCTWDAEQGLWMHPSHGAWDSECDTICNYKMSTVGE